VECPPPRSTSVLVSPIVSAWPWAWPCRLRGRV
jgi:hypothetical protein